MNSHFHWFSTNSIDNKINNNKIIIMNYIKLIIQSNKWITIFNQLIVKSNKSIVKYNN